MKQYEVLKWASLFLQQHQCDIKIADIWLQHLLGMSRTEFLLNMREPLPEDIVIKFKKGIKNHVQTGVPVQHLMGEDMFYGRTFMVNEHVLIPRPETEELVEHIISVANSKLTKRPLTIVDIGTGSGVIAITLALELSGVKVYATDISPHALLVARENAQRLGADIRFLEGNYVQPLIEHQLKVDILVSNPPYIAKSERDQLSRTVKEFDPEMALFADDHGLAAYKEILSLAPQVMKQSGALMFEIGYEQGEAVRELVRLHFPKSDVHVLQDLNGKDRIVSAILE